jgi:hypothetical protein
MDERLQVQATVAPPGSRVNAPSNDGPSQSPTAIRMTFFAEIPSNTPGAPDPFRPGGYRPDGTEGRQSPRKNVRTVSTNCGAAFPNTGPWPPFGTIQRYDCGMA